MTVNKQRGESRKALPFVFMRKHNRCFSDLPACNLLLNINYVVNIDHAVAQIFFVFSVTPTMTQSAMMANECGGDSEYVSMEVCVSTILGLVFIPFYVWLMQYIL